ESRASKRVGQYKTYLDILKAKFAYNYDLLGFYKDLSDVNKKIQTHLESGEQKLMSRKELEDIYEKYIKCAYTYESIDTSLLSKNEMDTYWKFRNVIAKDIKLFHDALADKNVDEFNFKDLFEDSRSVTVTFKDKNIQKFGAASSSRIRLKQQDENGKVIDGFFTPFDKKYTTDSQIKNSVATLAGNDELKASVVRFLLKNNSNFMSFYKRNITTTPYFKTGKELLSSMKNKEEFENLFKKHLNNDFQMFVDRKHYAKNSEEYKRVEELFKEFSHVKGQLVELVDEAKEMYDIPLGKGKFNYYGIDYTKQNDKRNSAMSTVAELIGCGNLLAKSKNMHVVIGDKTYKGTFMETAAGQDSATFNTSNDILKYNRKMVYNSPSLIKDLANMQILDYICGNPDRHGANFTYKFDNVMENGQQVRKLVGIQGIDNDLSFGLAHKGKDEISLGNVFPFKNFMIIPEDTAKNILNLKPEVLTSMLMGYDLSHREIKHALNRLNDVKEAILLGNEYYKTAENEKPQPNHLKILSDDEISKLRMNDLYVKQHSVDNRTKHSNMFSLIWDEAKGGFKRDNKFFNWKKNESAMVDAYKNEDRIYTDFKDLKAINAGTVPLRNFYDNMIKKTNELVNDMKNTDKNLFYGSGMRYTGINEGYKVLHSRAKKAFAATENFIKAEESRIEEETLKGNEVDTTCLEKAKKSLVTLDKIAKNYKEINDRYANNDLINTTDRLNAQSKVEIESFINTDTNNRKQNTRALPADLDRMQEKLDFDKNLNQINLTRAGNNQKLQCPYPDKKALALDVIKNDSRQLFIDYLKEANPEDGNQIINNGENANDIIRKINANRVLRYMIETDTIKNPVTKVKDVELFNKIRDDLCDYMKTNHADLWNGQINDFKNILDTYKANKTLLEQNDRKTANVGNYNFDVVNNYLKNGIGKTGIDKIFVKDKLLIEDLKPLNNKVNASIKAFNDQKKAAANIANAAKKL
ncbi:MAG: hypothetical protein K6G11_09150, partial [Lachnospiraceae bacterium]|nr:hypothetical protein [Lachnospiraceae bacterium]